MIRNEINVETGDLVEIQRIAYKNSNNELLILDEGEAAPDGYSQITDEEAIALNAQRLPPLTAVIMRQARLALLGAGMLTPVDAAIAAMTGTQGDVARIEWEFAATVQRDNPLVETVLSSLGMTSQQIDELFITAAGL